MVGGDAAHADALQQMIFVAIAGAEDQSGGTHDTTIGGAITTCFHGGSAGLDGIQGSQRAGSDIFLSNRVAFHNPAGKSVCRVFNSNFSFRNVCAGQIQILLRIVGDAAVGQLKMGIGLTGIEQRIDLRINLINVGLGHKFGGHAQCIANRKGFQYAFQNSQANSLISFWCDSFHSERDIEPTNWHRFRGASGTSVN